VARALSPVSHLPLTLLFDPAVVRVERVEAGRFLGGPGAAEVLSDVSKPGRLVLGASRLGETVGVAGEGDVARVVFRALAAGEADLRFGEARALDASLSRLALQPHAARVTVGEGSGAPRGPQVPDRPADRERPPANQPKTSR
jgi:hypothetical protein